ncbi:MAG: small multi-drug export protein [Oscillospiraceae bacterium]|nr:small multi-drug export protein [Oscillospiraceae bacterium]
MNAFFMTFLMAMLPVLELRGAIPYAFANELGAVEAFSAAVIGNMVPVPFIILFIRKIFAFMKKHIKPLGSLVDRLEARAQGKAELVHKYELLGLMVLVAIPLPGTGAWTGALVAAILNIRLRHALPSIFFAEKLF